MLPSERRRKILEHLLIAQTRTIRELAQQLSVHEITIRRDLAELEAQGLVEGVRGGARLVEQAQNDVAYEMRAQRSLEAKRLIAQEALRLVQEGDTVALDASTTCLELARILGARQRVHVLVTSLDAANLLAASKTPFSVIGGHFDPASRGLTGPLGRHSLELLHPDKVFFSGKGLTLEGGITDASLAVAEVKTRLIESAKSAYALLDHSKFGVLAFTTVVAPHQIDALITDREPDQLLRKGLTDQGVRLIVARGR